MVPADEVSVNLGGPCTVTDALRRTGLAPLHMVHFLRTVGANAGRTIGCNKALNAKRNAAIQDAKAWDDIKAECTICNLCSSVCSLPRSWLREAEEKADRTAGNADTSDLSDSELAPDSEQDSGTDSTDSGAGKKRVRLSEGR